MLCGDEFHSDVVGLANCLLTTWDRDYSVYVYVYYILGIASVVMPIVATILSDVESKHSRRLVTGVSAACVSLYAFLSPMDKIATYKSAHAELRESLMIYERLRAAAPPEQDAHLLRAFIDTIDAIEDRVLKSEITNDGDSAGMAKEQRVVPTSQAAGQAAGQADPTALLKDRLTRSFVGEAPLFQAHDAPPPTE